MRTLVFVFALMWAGVAAAKPVMVTKAHPDGISIDIPKEWSFTDDGTVPPWLGMWSFSPRPMPDVAYTVLTAKPGKLEDVFKAVGALLKNNLSDVRWGASKPGKIDGMEALLVEGTASDKTKKTGLSVIAVVAPNGNVVVVLRAADLAKQARFNDEMEAIGSSIRRTKK